MAAEGDGEPENTAPLRAGNVKMNGWFPLPLDGRSSVLANVSFPKV